MCSVHSSAAFITGPITSVARSCSSSTGSSLTATGAKVMYGQDGWSVRDRLLREEVSEDEAEEFLSKTCFKIPSTVAGVAELDDIRRMREKGPRALEAVSGLFLPP